MTIDHIAVRPGDPDYDTARTTIINTAERSVVLRPTSSGEVVASLHHARTEGLPIAIRSGGHNLLGFGNIDDGVVIDLSRLDQVEVLAGNRVRIGGGATWGPAAVALAEHGLAITSGDTASVGVGGLTQAGGFGWLVRKYGLALDSLVGAEVVTASGELVWASATENNDLFWALRGGAGNFGVVTTFEFQAHPVSTVHYGTIAYALDDTRELLRGWAAAMREAPEGLSTSIALMPGLGDFPAGAMLWVCLEGDDPTVLEPLRSIGTVLAEDIRERPYSEVLEEAHPPEGILPIFGNTLVESVDEQVINAITTAYAGGGRVVFLRSLGGAFGRVDAAATAFAHRGAEALVVSAAFLTPEATEDEIAAANSVWRTIADHGMGSYSGFLGSQTPEDVAAVWPAQTLERLRQVKRVWDPDNFFRHNLNIVP